MTGSHPVMDNPDVEYVDDTIYVLPLAGVALRTINYPGWDGCAIINDLKTERIQGDTDIILLNRLDEYLAEKNAIEISQEEEEGIQDISMETANCQKK